MNNLLAVNNSIANYHRQRQLKCNENLFAVIYPSSDTGKQEIWCQNNCFIYVLEGYATYHTDDRYNHLTKGNCLFVKKGTRMPVSFYHSGTFLLFSISDDFICEVLRSKILAAPQNPMASEPFIPVNNNALTQTFFQSMIPYFSNSQGADRALLELKFRELVLTLAGNIANKELRSYFFFLQQEPQAIILQQTMEENFCSNLRLEEFARLSLRSLSSFKRDFQQLYETSPGKWLLEKRLNKALQLLTVFGKPVNEAAFETGFESAAHFSRVFRQRFGNSPVYIKQQSALINFSAKQLLPAG